MLNELGVSTETLLRVEGVSRRFDSQSETVWAVKDANLVARSGEFVCIFGASGSGKSTLVNLMAGLDSPSQGSVLLGSTNISKLNEDKRAKLRLTTIGVVFQDHNLVEEFTALENVSLPLEVLGMGAKESQEQARIQLDRVGLGGLGHRPAPHFSGGQRQRIGIARALAGDRKVLLADEPTGALDSRNSRSLFELLRKLCDEGMLILVCSHDLMIREFADTVYEMVDGQVLRREFVGQESTTACD